MRWFKHLTLAHDDVALSSLLEAMGPEAYGIYWLMLEHFAAVMEKDCGEVPALAHSDVRWSDICHCSARTLRKFVQKSTELKLISSRSLADLKQFSSRLPAKRTEICIPKLLKYRDEYSRKSGVTPDKLPARLDTDTDTDTDKKTIPTHPSSGDAKVTPKIEQEFEEDWPKFWARVGGKKPTLEKYKQARNKISRERLMAAVVAQGPGILQRAEMNRSTPVYPVTWLNQERWEDEPVALVPARAAPRKAGVTDDDMRVFRERMQRDLEEMQNVGEIH